MNEPTPERHAFRPSERYITVARYLVQQIFDASDSVVVNLHTIPGHNRYQSWDKQDALYLGVLFAEPIDNPLLKTNNADLSLIKLKPSTDDLYEVRTYYYAQDSGELQVINSLFTTSEVATQGRDMIKAHASYRRHLEALLDRQQLNASDIEYMDFLDDLESYG